MGMVLVEGLVGVAVLAQAVEEVLAQGWLLDEELVGDVGVVQDGVEGEALGVVEDVVLGEELGVALDKALAH